jgi:NADPH:quinone reductase-like Zn-dependent oxidoreductase
MRIQGSTMGTREELGELASFLEVTGVRPLIDRTLPLDQARDGLAAMALGEVFGKVVLTP